MIDAYGAGGACGQSACLVPIPSAAMAKFGKLLPDPSLERRLGRCQP